MKKKIFTAASVAAIALVIGLGINLSKNEVPLSDLAQANVEALALEDAEGHVCYNTITSKEGSMIYYCPTCDWISGTDAWYAPSHKC